MTSLLGSVSPCIVSFRSVSLYLRQTLGFLGWCLSMLLVAGPCCNFLCMDDRLCRKTEFISVCFSYSFIRLSLSTLKIFNSSLRLLVVSTRFGGVSTTLISLDYSSLLWELSPHSWWVTILFLIACLGSHWLVKC